MPERAPTILIADDEPANRTLLTQYLGILGYSTLQAENGAEALRLIDARRPDAVLLDIKMPVQDGFQVLQQLKSRREAVGLMPVIVISGLNEMDKIAQSILMGAEDFLHKPFDAVLLKTRLESCLEKKRLREREIRYLKRIETEKERSDDLLRVMLPDEIVRELKTTGRVRPRRHADVTVLFCDIAGFTAYCEAHPPEEVLASLESLVRSFEEICHRHGVQKIKTIGDAFMAVSGLFRSNGDSALSAVKCGLEMLSSGRKLQPDWNLRVGVHCGSVVAGILGSRQYQFDVWGDTVNTAARLEKGGREDGVTVSAEVWRRVAGLCDGYSQGWRELKGKGKSESFLVTGAKEPLESAKGERLKAPIRLSLNPARAFSR